MKRTRMATIGLALGALLVSGCTYDRAPNRATAARWDTRDGDDRRIVERKTRGTTEVASPFGTVAERASAGGPGVGEEEPLPTQRVPPQGQAGVTDEIDVDEEPIAGAETPEERERVVAVEVEQQETSPALFEDEEGEVVERDATDVDGARERAERRPDAREGQLGQVPETRESPLIQRAEEEQPRVADRALEEIEAEDPPDAPLIAEGFLREQTCPMAVEGATVSLVQRPAGPVLVFETTDPDEVVELQNRVMALALTKDDERVEVTVDARAAADDEGTTAALDESFEPEVQPPQDTETVEGARGEMPLNLPAELSTGERDRAEEPVIAQRFAPLPEAEVTVEPTDDGAEMLFEAFTEGQRDELTRRLRSRASALKDGECPADTMSMVTRADAL